MDTTHPHPQPQQTPQHPQPTPSPSIISRSPTPNDSFAVTSASVEVDWDTIFTSQNSAEDQQRDNNAALVQTSAKFWPLKDHVATQALGTLVMSEIPDVDFLSRVSRDDPILQFASSLIVQTLRAFPRMMMRRETFPSFIHAHWCNTAGTGGLSLPEPLINCMGIAQMFISSNVESSSFLWRTVRNEQRLFIQNVRLLPFFPILTVGR